MFTIFMCGWVFSQLLQQRLSKSINKYQVPHIIRKVQESVFGEVQAETQLGSLSRYDNIQWKETIGLYHIPFIVHIKSICYQYVSQKPLSLWKYHRWRIHFSSPWEVQHSNSSSKHIHRIQESKSKKGKVI